MVGALEGSIGDEGKRELQARKLCKRGQLREFKGGCCKNKRLENLEK